MREHEKQRERERARRAGCVMQRGETGLVAGRAAFILVRSAGVSAAIDFIQHLNPTKLC